jgi:two-component system chemotaxis sensor kinase CheA
VKAPKKRAAPKTRKAGAPKVRKAGAPEVRKAGAPGAAEAGAPNPTLTDAALLDELALALMRAQDGPAGAVADLAARLERAVPGMPSLAAAAAQLGAAVGNEAGAGGLEAALQQTSDALERAMLATDAEGAPRSSDPPTRSATVVQASATGAAVSADATEGRSAAVAPDLAEPPARPTSAPAADAADGGGSPSPYDLELLGDFLAEGREHLEMAEAALLTLEEDPSDVEAVNVVFRAFHTIKGVAGFLDLVRVSDLAHRAESLLSRVREGELPFTSGVADLTLRSADALRALLDGVRPVLDGGRERVPDGLDAVMRALDDEGLIRRLASGEARAAGIAPVADPGADGAGDAESGEAPGAPEARGASETEGETSVRVSTGRLDRLVDLVGELVVAHSMVAQDPTLSDRHGDLAHKISRSGKILRELQDLSTSLRMVPLRGAFRKISRVVRDLSRRSGKQVHLVTEGEGTELDRNMVNVITDPLVHMIRNAVDHGLEDPEARRAAGKPADGRVGLSAYQAGGSVIIEVSDDGRGLDRERILAKARQRGIVESDQGLSDEEVFGLIFAPGFSTAEVVTEISGRGVGMDVVRRAVESLRGRVDVSSEPGRGSRFRIQLPLTLAITEGMLLAVGAERYIVPMAKIEEAFRPAARDLSTVSKRGELVALHGRLVPLIRLDRIYEIAGARQDPTAALLVVVGDGPRRSALMVDEILGQQHFVVKPLSGEVAHAPGVAGGAILGDGSVGLILEPDEIVTLARSGSGEARPGRSAA